MGQVQVEQVRLVALKPLPYHKIRAVDEVFTADKGYADMFVRQGLARLATPDDQAPASVTAPASSPVAATRAMTTGGRGRGSRKQKKD